MDTATPYIDVQARLNRCRTFVRLLDSEFKVPGTNIRFGLDPVIGLVPVVGDAVSLGAASYIVYEGVQMGLPTHKVARMVFNVGLDFALGSIPLLGDLFDVAFKANARNMNILEDHFKTT